ncbi:MAG: hypothetical protein AB7N76_35270 [Planctomycetota bacterium]
MKPARALGGAALVVAGLALAIPVGVGLLDPIPLDLAPPSPAPVGSRSLSDRGAIEAAFVVQQLQPGGRPRWRLRGARIEVVSGGADLLSQEVVDPRLEVYPREGDPLVLVAARARVDLERDQGDRVRILLRGDVRLRGPQGDLASEELTLWFDPREPRRARLSAPGRVRLELSEPPATKGGAARPPGAGTLIAASLEGTLDPLRLALGAPVELEAEGSAEAFAGTHLRGVARGGAVLTGDGPLLALAAPPSKAAQPSPRPSPQPTPAASASPGGSPRAARRGLELSWPERLRLHARAVELELSGASVGHARADALELVFGRVPLASLSAFGGLAGVVPGWRYALVEGEAHGDVRGALRDAPAVKGERAPRRPRDLDLAAGRVRLREGQRLELEGAPARVAERTQGALLSAPRLRVDLGDPDAVAISGERGVRVQLREPVPRGAGKPRRPPGVWSGSMVSALLVLDRAAAAELRASAAPVRSGATHGGAAQVGAGSPSAGSPSAGSPGDGAPGGGSLAPVGSGAAVAPVDSAGPFAWLRALHHCDLVGAVTLERTPGPDRIAFERLEWTRAPGWSPGTDPAGLGAAGPKATGPRGAGPGVAGTLAITGRVDALLGGLEDGRHAAAWRLRASRAQLELSGVAPVASGADVLGPLASLRAARLEDARLERQAETPGSADPGSDSGRGPREALAAARRARGLRGRRIDLSREGGEERLDVAGAAALLLGVVEVRAPALHYRPRSGRLTGDEVSVALTRPDGVYRVRARRGEALLETGQPAWDADRKARRAARRAGRLALVPGVLRALELRGELRVSGPAELTGVAEGLTLEGGRARLWGSPLRLEDRERALVAREVELTRDDAAGRTQVVARGEVEARGVLGREPRATPAGGAPRRRPAARSPLELVCGWLEAELRDPPERPRGTSREAWRAAQTRAPAPLGPFRAGGPAGVTVRVRTPAGAGGQDERRVALYAGAIAGRGVEDAAGPALDLELSGGWTAQLRLARRGPARVEGHGAAQARLDLAAARAGPRPQEPEEAYVRRLLRSLRAREGVSLTAQGLSALADEVELDGKRGVYVLRGAPAIVTRGGVSQRAQEWVLRLDEE